MAITSAAVVFLIAIAKVIDTVSFSLNLKSLEPNKLTQ